jgi:hypothetical protein
MFACFFQAIMADNFSFKVKELFRGIAEDTARIILLQNNRVIVDENLHSVMRMNTHGVTQLFWQHDSTKVIHFSYDPDAFHDGFPHCSGYWREMPAAMS